MVLDPKYFSETGLIAKKNLFANKTNHISQFFIFFEYYKTSFLFGANLK